MPRVLKEFVDKDTKVLYLPNSEFDGTAKRVKELEKLGFIEEKKQEKKPEDGE